MQSRSVTYIISNIEKSLSFEWIARELARNLSIDFILLNPAGSALEQYLVMHRIPVTHIPFYGKRSYPIVFLKLFFRFLFKRPDVVHAHLLDAQLLGLTAAWLARIKKRIYTRHNSNFHHVYFRKGIYYDQWSNAMATDIISISQATYQTLTHLENVNPARIHNIHHGFDLSVFLKRDADKIKLVRERWNIKNNFPCVGVIARHIEWKGVQFILPAFEKLLGEYPDATLVLANAKGPYGKNIEELLKHISADRYVLIPFEEDVASLFATFDIYVHTPVDPICEAFGQSYVEALASGVPSIFTLSGVAVEFIEHKKNAWVVDYMNSEEIYTGMIRVLKDQPLREQLALAGKESVKLFGLDITVNKHLRLYNEH